MSDLELFVESPYTYNGVHVPRVTEILGSMLTEEYLMYWAQKMGRIHKDIDTMRDTAADKGSIVHEMCENFLRYRMLPNFDAVPQIFRKQCRNAFDGFLIWINNLEANGHFWKPLMLEVPVVNELYGGTLDCLMQIDDKIYLLDFKTSNQLSWKYCLQVAAYRKSLRELHGIVVDGCCVLRFDKYSRTFPEEMMYDCHDRIMGDFMDQCEALFVNIAQAYWQRAQVEREYKRLTGLKRV